MRFISLFTVAALLACSSTPRHDRFSSDTGAVTLDQAIADLVQGAAESRARYMRRDTALWYWSFDFAGIRTPEIAAALEHRIRSRAQQTANDTLTATRRYLIAIARPKVISDSAVVKVVYETSWEHPCSWLHASSIRDYIFRHRAGSWSFAAEMPPLFADPPLPESVLSRPCKGRGSSAANHTTSDEFEGSRNISRDMRGLSYMDTSVYMPM